MGVLVEDMAMPQDCFECIFFDETSNWCEMHDQHLHNQKDETGRAKWCPLVEVPTPHGGLIDAETMKADLEKRVEETMSEVHKEMVGLDVRIDRLVRATMIDREIKTAKEWIDRQPIVLEAEE